VHWLLDGAQATLFIPTPPSIEGVGPTVTLPVSGSKVSSHPASSTATHSLLDRHTTEEKALGESSESAPDHDSEAALAGAAEQVKRRRPNPVIMPLRRRCPRPPNIPLRQPIKSPSSRP
jgi:hypothetical protein